MRKNPYLLHAEKLKQDSRSENIIKKAKRYGVVVYDNPTLGKNLLNVNIEDSGLQTDYMIEFFAWILKSEKKVQMSGD